VRARQRSYVPMGSQWRKRKGFQRNVNLPFDAHRRLRGTVLQFLDEFRDLFGIVGGIDFGVLVEDVAILADDERPARECGPSFQPKALAIVVQQGLAVGPGRDDQSPGGCGDFEFSRGGARFVGQQRLVQLPGIFEQLAIARLMAEELVVEQVFVEGSAVHGDERPVAPRTVAVDRAGHELLAGSRIATDQNRDTAAGHFADELVNILHRATVPQHLQAIA